MKKQLGILAAGVALVVLIVGTMLLCTAYFGQKLDASSKAYVDESIPAIITNWSQSELAKRASPQLLQKSSSDQVDHLFKTLSSRFGAFQSYDGAKGRAHMSFTTKYGEYTTAFYVATAAFRNGNTQIEVELIQEGGAWAILGFHVNLEP